MPSSAAEQVIEFEFQKLRSSPEMRMNNEHVPDVTIKHLLITAFLVVSSTAVAAI